MSTSEDDEDELSSPFLPIPYTNILTATSKPPTQQQQRQRQSSLLASESSSNATPNTNLRRLASLAQPQAPSSIASERMVRRTALQNPVRNSATRNLTRRPIIGEGMPTTPHAIRAMEERRRVAMTPSRERRRASGRGLERGSPFEVLRALSRAVASNTTVATEAVREEVEEEEQEEEDVEISVEEGSESSEELPRPPRLSLSAVEMGIGEDDDTRELNPPEMSRLDEEDFTLKSVEGSRRAVVEGRVGRLSEFSGLFDAGKSLLEDGAIRRVASPSFVGGQVSLDDLGVGDETIDFGRITADRGTASPQALLEREIDLADSTFRFDIPQDITEGVSVEENEDEILEEDEIEVEAVPAINESIINDDDSGPEDFGSPSASEVEEQNAIDEDINVGEFLDDEAQEDEASEDEDAEEDGSQTSIQPRVSDELENQTKADESAINAQTSSEIRDTTKLPSELEVEETEDFVPQPPTIPIPRPQISKAATGTTAKKIKRAPKPAVVSKYGQKVPSLPAGVVKSLADSFLPHAGKNSKKTKKDTVAALSQATDWFFEQVASDLDAYSKHADRDVIEESDVIALMKRQRVLATGAKNVQGNRSAAPGSSRATLFSLAQRFLPRELMTELRMEPPPDERQKKRRRISEGGEFG